MSTSGAGWVGRPIPRREDVRFLRGEAKYLDDIELPGLLEAAFVRSPYAHARLGAIDTAAAHAVPGVEAVLTGADLGDRARPLPVGGIEGGVVADAGHPVLARDRVRYAGEAVALVVAGSRAVAEDAAELVEVDYEPLEPVLDPRTAAGAALLHDGVAENRLFTWERTNGDVEGAFAAADRVVSQSFHIPRLVAAPIEPRGAFAVFDPFGDLLTVCCSAQDPHRPLAQLVASLGDDPGGWIRVVVPDVGGAFGSKGVIAPEVAAIARAAIGIGRSVRWVEDRAENFVAAYQGRGLDADVELAVASDGRILGLRATLYADLGAYLYATTAVAPHTTAMLITGAYDIPAARVEVVGAATTKVPTGPYRGAGRPEAAFLIERMVDLAAQETGVDAVELRRRNFVRPDAFPYVTPMGWTYDSGDFERCLDSALELAPLERWQELKAEARGEGRVVGVGVGMYIERAGGLWESALVRVEADGRVVVRTGSSPHGQGHETTFAQIAADELGVEPEAVEILWGDSGELPGVGTFASRSVAMGGSAIAVASRELAERARSAGISLAELAAAEGGVQAESKFSSGLVFASGAYAALVEVERATGRLLVLGLAAVDDSGRIINPLLAEGQVLGATVQGLGQCLVEEAVHDEEGQLRTSSFADYSLLTAAELPPIESRFVETLSPLNPLGAKGIGEGGAIATPAAVANAVADALAPFGVRHVDPPFTEAKLWRLLQ